MEAWLGGGQQRELSIGFLETQGQQFGEWGENARCSQ